MSGSSARPAGAKADPAGAKTGAKAGAKADGAGAKADKADKAGAKADEAGAKADKAGAKADPAGANPRSLRSSPPPAPLPLSPLVDAHTHLDACGAHDAAGVHAIVDRAANVGVQAVVTIADDLASAQWVTEAADWDERVYAAVALHPTRANALTDDARAKIQKLAAHPRVVAIGETGLDNYWPGRLDGCAQPAAQREAFAWHIDLAKRSGKPLMIHNRDADRDVLDVLRAEGAPDTVIFHCFSSDATMARTCLAAGWLLSLSGTVSFRNAFALHEAAKLIPPDQLLVETDAPFLTPHPYRGAPNEPYCLPYTVRALAELTGRPAERLARDSTATASRVYGLDLRTSA